MGVAGLSDGRWPVPVTDGGECVFDGCVEVCRGVYACVCAAVAVAVGVVKYCDYTAASVGSLRLQVVATASSVGDEGIRT